MYAVAGICCGNLRHLELRTVYVWYKLFVIFLTFLLLVLEILTDRLVNGHTKSCQKC